MPAPPPYLPGLVRVGQWTILSVGIVFIVCIPIATLGTIAWERYESGLRATTKTSGKVVSFDGSNHDTGSIVYKVHNVQYETAKSGMRPSDVGRTVPLHYDPRDPRNAYCDDSPRTLTDKLIAIGLLVAVILALTISAAIKLPTSVSRWAETNERLKRVRSSYQEGLRS